MILHSCWTNSSSTEICSKPAKAKPQAKTITCANLKAHRLEDLQVLLRQGYGSFWIIASHHSVTAVILQGWGSHACQCWSTAALPKLWEPMKYSEALWHLMISPHSNQQYSMHFNALLNQMLSSVCVFIQLWTEEQVRTPTLNSSKQPLACPAILMFKMAPTPTTLLQDATSPVLCENALPELWQPRQLQSDSAVRLFRSHSGLEKRRFLWSEQASCSISYTFELWYLSKGHVNVVTGSFLCFCAKTLSNSCALPGRELAFLVEFDV